MLNLTSKQIETIQEVCCSFAPLRIEEICKIDGTGETITLTIHNKAKYNALRIAIDKYSYKGYFLYNLLKGYYHKSDRKLLSDCIYILNGKHIR